MASLLNSSEISILGMNDHHHHHHHHETNHGGEEECPPLSTQAPAWQWVYSMQPAYMMAVSVTGITGNAFVLAVLSLHTRRQHRTTADVYLANLAAADLLLTCSLPFWVHAILHEFRWVFGTAMCRMVSLLIGMNYLCSVLFLTVVSVDRYVALAKPLAHRRGRHRVALAWAVCGAVWVLSGLLTLPALLFRSVHILPELGVEACILEYPHADWRIRYNLTANLVGFLIPVPIVAFSTYNILAVLNSSKQLRRSIATAASEGQGGHHTERKAASLVLAVLAMFVLCWLPFQLVLILDTLHHYKVISGCVLEDVTGLDIWSQLASCLGYSNSAINPFLYVMVGKHFRQRAGAILRSITCRDRRTSASTHSPTTTVRSKYTECSAVAVDLKQ